MDSGETRASGGDDFATGRNLALALRRRFPEQDWLGALAKAAVLPRGEVEWLLQQEGPPPPELVRAADEVEGLLAEPAQDAAQDDHAFAATTNDADAPMEVDREAGMTVSPANKGMPSRSGSAYEMRIREHQGEPNPEDLPLVGVPEAILPLHRKPEG